MRSLITLGIGALVLSTSSLTAQMIIEGITVTPSSEWENGTNGRAVNLTNNSGLVDATDETTPAPYDLTAKHGWQSSANDSWHTQHIDNDPDPNLTFDLGGAFDLTGIYIWNGNQGGDANNIKRDVQTFDLHLSTDGGNNYDVYLSGATLDQGVTDTLTSAQFFDLSGNEGVTHIYMDVLSNYGGAYTGLGEVMVTAVPEPSTYALLLGVAACGIAMIRRRIRR